MPHFKFTREQLRFVSPLFVIFYFLQFALVGCRAPRLYEEFPGDRVVVMEDGVRKELVLVCTSWPGFPTGGPLNWLTEERPAPDAASLREAKRQTPDRRFPGHLSVRFVYPMQRTTADNTYAWETYHRHLFILSLKPVIVGVAAEPMPELPLRPEKYLVRVQDLDGDVRIVRLLWAQRFPDGEAIRKVSGKARSRTHRLEDEQRAVFELLDPCLIELDHPMTIGEAMKFIEANEEFHTVKP